MRAVVVCCDGPSSVPTSFTRLVTLFHAFPLLQADHFNHIIRLIILSSGLVSTLAGTSGVSGSSNGIGTTASLYYPSGVAMDANGTVALVVSSVYIKQGCNCIRCRY